MVNVVGDGVQMMSKMHVHLHGKEVIIPMLLSASAISLLPDSLILRTLRSDINTKGLIASRTCQGYWLLYKGADVVGYLCLRG